MSRSRVEVGTNCLSQPLPSNEDQANVRQYMTLSMTLSMTHRSGDQLLFWNSVQSEMSSNFSETNWLPGVGYPVEMSVASA